MNSKKYRFGIIFGTIFGILAVLLAALSGEEESDVLYGTIIGVLINFGIIVFFTLLCCVNSLV